MATVRGKPVAWENFYKTARWQRLRKFQLMQHPLCKFCLERGIVTAANVADHVVPHKATGPHSSPASCRAYANHATGRRSGNSSCAAIAATSASDGLLTDPNHLFNHAR